MGALGALSDIVDGLFDIGGSHADYMFQDKLAEQENRWQKEFAQNTIQWKTQDAINAGLHPLAALGAQTMSYAPSRVGGTNFSQGFSGMGQAISRAMSRYKTKEQKAQEQLQNDFLASQTRRNNAQAEMFEAEANRKEQAGSPPPAPRS